MKYEIIKNGLDDYSLKYKDKEIRFHSDVETITKMQSINEIAKEEMILSLAERGKTIKDLIKEYKENGKTYQDNSSRDELLKVYIDKTSTKIYNEAVEKCLGITFEKLVSDIELDNEKQQQHLAIEIGEILVGRFQDKGQNKVEQ